MVADRARRDIGATARSNMNLSFAGCGFLGIYHVGVCSCFRRYASHLSTEKISGASAGALAACALLTGVGLGESTNYVLDVALKARARALGPLHPSFNIVHHLKEGLQRFLPDNAHEICSGRLHVSLTRVSDRKNVLVSQFDSREDLIEALNCSAFVPFYSGVIPPKYKGVRYVDGGLSDNIPILDENTITVSPFAGESDICPNDNSSSFLHVYLANTSIQVNSSNLYRMSHALFPPSPEQLSSMCQQGFDDALKFLQKNDLISCARHLRIESAITPIVCNNDADDSVYTSHVDTDSDSLDKMTINFRDDESDSESDFSCNDSFCEECQHHQNRALTDSLPHPVVSALQAGIDSVNTGVLAPVYKLRAYKVLSLLTAPWLLPIDLAILLAKKFFVWAQYLPSDMQWFTQELVILLQDLYESVQRGRHKYSARFSCQLAITETSGQSGASEPAISPLIAGGQRHGSSEPRRNLNVGFSVDFHTEQKSALHCIGDLHRHPLEAPESQQPHHHCRHKSGGDDGGGVGGVGVGGVEPTRAARSRRGSFHITSNITADNQLGYDTFDNYLHITRQMDAVLAYHYTAENDPNVIKVTEIFALDDPLGPRPDADANNDLSWDNYMHEVPAGMRRCQTDIFTTRTTNEQPSTSAGTLQYQM